MKKIIFTVIVLSSLSVTACSKAPKCSDNEVTNLALNLSKDMWYKKVFRFQVLSNPTALFSALDPSIGPYGKDNNDLYIKVITGSVPEINELANYKDPKFVEYVNNLKAKCNEMKIESIRTASKDDSVKKCTCEADLIIDNNNKETIQYNAQKTDDGKIYVEVNEVQMMPSPGGYWWKQ